MLVSLSSTSNLVQQLLHEHAGLTKLQSLLVSQLQQYHQLNAIHILGIGTAQHHTLSLSAGFSTITVAGGSVETHIQHIDSTIVRYLYGWIINILPVPIRCNTCIL